MATKMSTILLKLVKLNMYSKHISKIKTTDLITSSRNEQYIYYSINRSSSLYPVLDMILKESKESQMFLDDLGKLNTIETFVCER